MKYSITNQGSRGNLYGRVGKTTKEKRDKLMRIFYLNYICLFDYLFISS